jgi:hypothetical protein
VNFVAAKTLDGHMLESFNMKMMESQPSLPPKNLSLDVHEVEVKKKSPLLVKCSQLITA